MKEEQPDRMKNRIVAITLILVITIVFVVIFIQSPYYMLVDMLLNPDPFDDRPFNQEVWLEHFDDWDGANPRGRMAYSVRDILLETHMTRAEVIEMLGPPEYDSAEYSIRYLLGAWSGIRIDYDLMEIFFDEHDRVKEIRIYGS